MEKISDFNPSSPYKSVSAILSLLHFCIAHCPNITSYSCTLQNVIGPFLFLARLYPKTLVLCCTENTHDAHAHEESEPRPRHFQRPNLTTLLFCAKEHKPDGCSLGRNRRIGSSTAKLDSIAPLIPYFTVARMTVEMTHSPIS